MKNGKAGQYIKIAIAAIWIFVISLCIYVFCFSDNERTRITSTGQITSVREFVLNGTEEIVLPYSHPFKRGEQFELSFMLPEELPENNCLSFRSLYSANEVFVDGKLIGSYGTRMPLPFGRMTGNIRVIVPLDAQMAGKEMKLVITPYYSVNADISAVDIGYTDEIKREIFNDNMFRILVVTVLITIMFIAIGINIYQIISGSKEQLKLIRGFVLFDFLVVTWILCSSDVPQFLTNCNEGVSLVSFLCLSMICIPLMIMCECIIPEKKNLFVILGRLGYILPLMICFGFALNLYDPMDVLLCTHIYIIICIVIVTVCACKEWKSGISSKFLLVGIIEIAVAAIIGLLCWYSAPSKGYDAVAFSIGFVLFITTLFALIGYEQIKMVEEKKYMDIYKKLAYTDSLTMLKNRTAFELKFSQMQENDYKNVDVSLFMFDLNNLKKTNDTLGHQMGDKLIVGTARTIQKVFGDIGDCFRLGGDEFGVILTGYDGDISELKTIFTNELAQYGIDNELEVSCAVGYAGMKWSPGDTFFRDIYKIADREMYADKVRTKHGTLPEGK